MTPFSPVAEIKKALPESSWPWVVPALRQEPLVWSALVDRDFLRAALEQAAGVAERWSPAFLALLALEQPFSLENLRKAPLQSAGEKLRHRSAHVYEDLTHGDGSNSESGGLVEAGLLALALRERLRLSGSWESFVSDVSIAPAPTWRAPLACLFGMLPEPEVMMATLFGPERLEESRVRHTAQWHSLALHALLCNPLPPERQVDILIGLIEGDTIHEQLTLLLRLENQRPALARQLARRIAAEARSVERETGPSPDRAQSLLHLAEVYGIAGDCTLALTLLDNAHEASQRSQAELAARLAQAAARGEDSETTLAALKKAAELDPDTSKASAHFILASLQAGQLVPPQGGQQGRHTDSSAAAPASLLAAARLAQESGKKSEAQTLARGALEALSQQDGSLVSADLAGLLAGMLLELDLPADAGQAARLGLETYPNDIELLHALSRASAASGDAAGGLQAAHLATALAPERADLRRGLSQALIAAEAWEAAFQELERLTGGKEEPQAADLYALVNCALQLGRTRRAVEACEQAIQLDPKDGKAQALLGQALARAGETREAAEHFQQATKLSPHLPEPWLALAEHQSGQGESREALNTLRMAVEAAPDVPQLQFALGEALRETDEREQALSAFRRASELVQNAFAHPGDLPQQIALHLGRLLLELGRLEDSRQTLEQAHQAYPANPHVAHALARTYMALDKPEPALSALAIAREARPDDPQLNLDFARAQMALERGYEQAIEALRRVIESAPEQSEALGLLALALSKNGDYAQALKCYQQALETDLAADQAWRVRLSTGLGEAASRLEQPEIAIAALQEARQTAPEDATILRTLSEAYRAAALQRDALEAAREVVRLEADDLQAQLWFADQALKLEAQEEAVEALMRAAEIAPDSTETLVRLGYLQMHSGEPKAAKATFMKLFSSENASAKEVWQAARALVSLGDLANGVAYFERAVELNPEPSAELLKDLADAQIQAENYGAGLETVERNLKLTPNDPELLVTRADLLLRLKRPQAALTSLEHALEMTPDHGGLHHRIALILRETGDLASALVHAEKAIRLGLEDLRARALAAETARAGLLFERAREILAAPHFTESGSSIRPEDATVLNALCLRGELALDADEEIEAAESIAPLIELDTDSARPLALKARLASRRGDQVVATETLERAITALERSERGDPPKHEQTNLRLAVAEAALENKQWDGALYLLRQAVANAPLEPLLHLTLVRAAVLRAEYQLLCQAVEALSHQPGAKATSDQIFKTVEKSLQTALRCAPFDETHPQIHHWQVRARAVFGADDARTKPPPSYPASAQETAAALRGSKDVAEAIRLAKKHPEHPLVLAQLALVLSGRDPRKALLSARKAAEGQPDNPLFQALFARLAFESREYEGALESIQKALEVWDDEPRWHALAAQAHIQMSDLPQAIPHLERTVQLEPDSPEHLLRLGQAYLQAGNPGNAIRTLERAVQRTSKEPQAWLALAKAHQAIGELSEAANSVEQVIKLTPRAGGPLLLRAEIAAAAADHQKAFDFARAALEFEPQNSRALLLHARSLHALGRTTEAVAALDKAVSASREPLPLLLERALLLGLGEGKRAGLEALKKLAKRHPENAGVLAALSESLAALGENEKAIQVAQHAVRANPDGLEADDLGRLHHHLGGLLRQAGQLDQAIHHLNEAVRLAPERVEPYLELGAAHQERRQHDLALEYFKQAIAAAPGDPRPYWELGQALKESKDYGGAETMLRRAATLAPKDLNIQRQLAAVVALNLVHHSDEASVDA